MKYDLKKYRKLNILTLLVTWTMICAATSLDILLTEKINFATNIFLLWFSYGLIFFILLFSFYAYVRNYYPSMLVSPKQFAALNAILAVGFISSVFLSILHMYAMTITLSALLVPMFFDSKLAFVTNVYTAILIILSISGQAVFSGISFNHGFLTMIIISFVCGTILSFLISKSSNRFYFICTSILVNLLALPVMVLAELFDPTNMEYLIEGARFIPIQLIGATVLALLLQPLIEQIFNVTSNFKLIELTDHNRPLLKRMAETAPGTFNHSLTVANLTETCAGAIGENIYMARACAYYHDVGKLKNPLFFKENQATDENPHDELTPESSTDIIRKHVLNGAAICKEYRLPSEISDVTREHHGTTSIAYFYHKAKELTDGRELDIKEYCYPGPIPSTKISALIMICDTCEAAIRSMDKPNTADVDRMVGQLIKQRLDSGQFDNCPITMQDLQTIRQTIVNAVCGLYHQRIKYPDGK